MLARSVPTGQPVQTRSAVFRPSLPSGLVQGDRRRRRYVQAARRTGHRNPYQPIARLPHQPSESRSLRTKNERGRLSVVRRVVPVFSLAGESDGPHAQTLQFLDGPRDVHDGRDPHVTHGASRRFHRGAIERRRVAGLPYDARPAHRINRSDNRTDILGILDAIEHDDERRTGGLANQLLDRVGRKGLHLRRHALMDAAIGATVQGGALDRVDRNAQLLRPGQQTVDARARAPHVDDPRHAPRRERLGHGMNAVDQGHPLPAPVNSATRLALAAHDRTGANPEAGPRRAPRSIAGTARSSSGPESAAVRATRIGWNRARPLRPVISRTRAAAARNPSRSSAPRLATSAAKAPTARAPSGSAITRSAARAAAQPNTNATRSGISSSRSTDPTTIGNSDSR